MGGLSSLYSHLLRSDYEKALPLAEEAYRIISTQPNATFADITTALGTLSDIYIGYGDYDKASFYAESALDYAEQGNQAGLLRTSLEKRSYIYLRQGKYKESEQTAFRALQADSSDMYINSILYSTLSEANIYLGNKEKSMAYFKKTLDTHRAYSNAGFQASLSEMEVRYETEKKNLTISALEEEKRLILWLSIAGACLLLTGVVALFLLWRWTVQNGRLTAQQKQLAEQQVKRLEQEQQLVATQAVLDGETQERTRLARDLHDGLGSMLTGVKLNLESMKTGVILEHVDTACFDSALKILDDSMRELRRVAHHLMPEALNRYGLKPAIGDFCRSLSPIIVFDWFGSEERIDPKSEVVIDRESFDRLKGLINNEFTMLGCSP